MRLFIIGLIILALLAVGIVFISNKGKVPKQAQTSPSDTTTTITPASIPTAEPAEIAKLQQGGSSFADPKGVFTFLYPNDYTFDTQNSGQYIRVYKKGPSQQGQTEMYDGVIITFESVDLKGQSLDQWVNTQIQNAKGDGTSQITQPKTEITLHGYPGFTYSARGLGEFDNIIIQKTKGSAYAVSVNMLVADPKQQGFQKEVDAILETIQLQK